MCGVVIANQWTDFLCFGCLRLFLSKFNTVIFKINCSERFVRCYFQRECCNNCRWFQLPKLLLCCLFYRCHYFLGLVIFLQLQSAFCEICYVFYIHIGCFFFFQFVLISFFSNELIFNLVFDFLTNKIEKFCLNCFDFMLCCCV